MSNEIIEDLAVAYMRDGMFKYLANNPQDSIINIAVDMTAKGINIEFVSKITGVPTNEINKLQNNRH